MKKDLYKEAITSEQDSLKKVSQNVHVALKSKGSVSTTKNIWMTVGVAAALVVAIFTIIPDKEMMELRRAEKFMAKLELPERSFTYSYNTGKNSIEKFNEKVERINAKHTLIRKFNAMIDKYEQQN